MAGKNYITPSAGPRPTGAASNDARQTYEWLFGLAGEMEYRLGEMERRLGRMEKQIKTLQNAN